MKKIKLIEKRNVLSLKNLDEIIGGFTTTYDCGNGGTLTCTPFTGSCVSVTIGDDTYTCDASIYSLVVPKSLR